MTHVSPKPLPLGSLTQWQGCLDPTGRTQSFILLQVGDVTFDDFKKRAVLVTKLIANIWRLASVSRTRPRGEANRREHSNDKFLHLLFPSRCVRFGHSMPGDPGGIPDVRNASHQALLADR
jgi:hypothetical protein